MAEIMTLKKFESKYHNEEACVSFLIQRRLGHFDKCPQCKNNAAFENIPVTYLARCSNCDLTYDLKQGAIFEGSSTPVRKWMKLLALICCFGFETENTLLMPILKEKRKTIRGMKQRIFMWCPELQFCPV